MIHRESPLVLRDTCTPPSFRPGVPNVVQVAVLQLVLTGLGSPLAGREFEVELPSPRNGQAEFVVLSSRFEAAVWSPWRIGDRCQVPAPCLPLF